MGRHRTVPRRRQAVAAFSCWWLLPIQLVVASVAANASNASSAPAANASSSASAANASSSASAANASSSASAANASNAVSNRSKELACYAKCPGLLDFTERLKEVLKDESLNRADICRVVQADRKAAQCIFNNPQICMDFFSQFYLTRKNCEKMGIDILQEGANNTYPATTCRMCVNSKGARLVRSYWDKPSVAACEAHCAKEARCSVYDYDATQSMCRIWESCPEPAQSKRFGCQWTVYSKPGWEPPTRPPRPQNVAQNDGTTPSLRIAATSTTGAPDRRPWPSDRGVAVAAAPRQGLPALWQALLVAACIGVVALDSSR